MHVLCLIVGLSTIARAGVFLRTGGMYSSTSSGAVSSARLYLDVNPGWVTEKGWAVGATYQVDSNSGYLVGSSKSYGLTVGWVSRRDFGWYLLGTFYLRSTLDDGRRGTGGQGDLGYRVAFRHLSFALQMSYKTYTYPKPPAASSPDDTAKFGASVAHLDPYFVLAYEF